MRLGMEKNAHGEIFQIGGNFYRVYYSIRNGGGHMPHIDYFYRIS